MQKEIEAYLSALTDERRNAVSKIMDVLKENLPEGFSEELNYGMIGYVVPHSLYPSGYHCDPKLPLPFINVASQKHFVGLYHMGIYADEEILKWFTEEYPNHCKYKLDMGKSCIRFKKLEDIPYDLIAELSKKISPAQWIGMYESSLKTRKRK